MLGVLKPCHVGGAVAVGTAHGPRSMIDVLGGYTV